MNIKTFIRGRLIPYCLAVLAGGTVLFLTEGLPMVMGEFGSGPVDDFSLVRFLQWVFGVYMGLIVFALAYGVLPTLAIWGVLHRRPVLPLRTAILSGMFVGVVPMALGSLHLTLSATSVMDFDYLVPATLIYVLAGGTGGAVFWWARQKTAAPEIVSHV